MADEEKYIKDGVIKALGEILPQKEQELRNQIKKQGKVATQKLLNSVGGEIVEKGTVVSLEVRAENYQDNIESGRRAGTKGVPVEELKSWAAAKGISTDSGTLYRINAAIVQRGIQAVPIASSVPTDDIAGILAKSLKEAIEQTTSRLVNQMNKK